MIHLLTLRQYFVKFYSTFLPSKLKQYQVTARYDRVDAYDLASRCWRDFSFIFFSRRGYQIHPNLRPSGDHVGFSLVFGVSTPENEMSTSSELNYTKCKLRGITTTTDFTIIRGIWWRQTRETDENRRQLLSAGKVKGTSCHLILGDDAFRRSTILPHGILGEKMKNWTQRQRCQLYSALFCFIDMFLWVPAYS